MILIEHVRSADSQRRHEIAQNIALRLIDEVVLLTLLLEFDNALTRPPANRSEYAKKLRALISEAEKEFGPRWPAPASTEGIISMSTVEGRGK